MTAEQLEELLGKVTQGEWRVGKQVIGIRNEHGFQHHIVHLLWDTVRGKANATLIALAPTLARRVIAAEKLVYALREIVTYINEYLSDDTGTLLIDMAKEEAISAITAYREASK